MLLISNLIIIFALFALLVVSGFSINLTKPTSLHVPMAETGATSRTQVRNNSSVNKATIYFLIFICLEVAFLAVVLLGLLFAYYYDSAQGVVISLFLLVLLAADSAVALSLIHKTLNPK